MRRALCVTTNRGRGGIAVAVDLYARTLVRLGYIVEVLCYEGEMVTELVEELRDLQVAMHILPSGWRWKARLNPFLFFRLWRLTRQADFILLHNATILPLFRCFIPRSVMIAVNHMGKNRNFHKADFIFCPTAGVRARVLVNPAVAPERAAVVELALRNLPVLPPVTPDDAPRLPLTIGACGRLVQSKGFQDLLAAFAVLPRQRFRLLIKGEGWFRETLEEQIETLGITQRVSWQPWSAEISSFYSALDVFCCPSREEPFGFVMIEAMAHGVPVVATATDGGTAIVRHGQTGLLVPPRDIPAMREALMLLGNDEALRHALGCAARREAETRFSPQAFQNTLRTTLGTALAIGTGR